MYSLLQGFFKQCLFTMSEILSRIKKSVLYMAFNCNSNNNLEFSILHYKYFVEILVLYISYESMQIC